MAYATYTTEAIVCGSKPSNTADRSFLLFTKDAGMLWATARSVRAETSKQRYALQDFSRIKVSLVRGKSGWRIGSVEALENAFMSARTREARTRVQSVVRLIRRFVHGEEAIPVVYEDTCAVLSLVAGVTVRNTLLDQFTLRLLHQLGYIAAEPSFQYVLDTPIATIDDLLPTAAGKAIDRALAASHL